MPYVAQRAMTVLARRYRPGEEVPADGLDRRTLESCLHTGRLKYVDRETLAAQPARAAASAPASKPKAAPRRAPPPAAPTRVPRRIAPAPALAGG